MTKRGKPFARYRVEYHHFNGGIVPCECERCLLAERLSGERCHSGIIHSSVRRLDYRREEALEETARDVEAYYQMVAHELAQPLTMGFDLKGGA